MSKKKKELPKIPARIAPSLIKAINERRKKEGHSWPWLATILFEGYVKHGCEGFKK